MKMKVKKIGDLRDLVDLQDNIKNDVCKFSRFGTTTKTV